MHAHTTLLLAAALLAGCAVPPPAPEPMDEATAMMKMMELAAPGEAHAGLMALAGEWNVRLEYRMSPEQPWQTMEAKVKNQAALGGRWLVGKWSGSFGGMPFEGLQLMGYSNLDRRYESFWTDNMSTWMIASSGDYDESGALRMRGVMKDFVTPEGRPYGSVTTIVDADHYRTVMVDTIPPAGEVEIMRMEFTRAQ